MVSQDSQCRHKHHISVAPPTHVSSFATVSQLVAWLHFFHMFMQCTAAVITAFAVLHWPHHLSTYTCSIFRKSIPFPSEGCYTFCIRILHSLLLAQCSNFTMIYHAHAAIYMLAIHTIMHHGNRQMSACTMQLAEAKAYTVQHCIKHICRTASPLYHFAHS
jgi:hypothetical protein